MSSNQRPDKDRITQIDEIFLHRTAGPYIRVKPGKAQSEQILSALPPVADSDADMLERQLRANNGVMHCNMICDTLELQAQTERPPRDGRQNPIGVRFSLGGCESTGSRPLPASPSKQTAARHARSSDDGSVVVRPGGRFPPAKCQSGHVGLSRRSRHRLLGMLLVWR
jgi:hypothetical protein